MAGCAGAATGSGRPPTASPAGPTASSTVTGSPSPSPSTSPSPSAPAGVLFDDFDHADMAALETNGWIVRTTPGWPGVPGAGWSKSAASIVDDPDQPGNRLLRLTATTDGTPKGTTQAQVCHERKYRDGTSATRIRFTSEPESGPDGDVVVQSFYALTPYGQPLDPTFSELDFEYLPNGGWGTSGPGLWNTTWESVRIEPWNAVNDSDTRPGDLAGWHTLVTQAAGKQVRYFLDGDLVASHGEPYYPESPMSVNYNLWFVADALIGSTEPRTWVDEIDWTFHAARRALSPAEVDAEVSRLRTAGSAFQDTVPEWAPPQTSPCDL